MLLVGWKGFRMRIVNRLCCSFVRLLLETVLYFCIFVFFIFIFIFYFILFILFYF